MLLKIIVTLYFAIAVIKEKMIRKIMIVNIYYWKNTAKKYKI